MKKVYFKSKFSYVLISEQIPTKQKFVIVRIKKLVIFPITEKSVQTTVTTLSKSTIKGKGFYFCFFFFIEGDLKHSNEEKKCQKLFLFLSFYNK